MPTANPELYPWLFTAVNTPPIRPTYKRPGAFNITAKQAIALVQFLNLLGFKFSIPKYKDSSMEGHWINADPADETLREYVASHIGVIGENNLAMVADNLGGIRSSPKTGLFQTMDEVNLKFKDLATDPTDEQIVSALKTIFG